MKAITAPSLKAFIHDIINFEDGVDANGNRIKRNVFPVKFFKPYKTLSTKLDDDISIILAPKDKAPNEVLASDLLFWKKNAGPQDKIHIGFIPAGEMFRDDDPIEITNEEIAALKFFTDERKVVRDLSLELFEEFEALLK